MSPLVDVSGCAWINGLHIDSGPCQIADLPIGLWCVLAAMVIGWLIGRWVIR